MVQCIHQYLDTVEGTMIPTKTKPYISGDHQGQLRIGWASWDKNKYNARSIKWAYSDDSGKISRGAPELPFHILLDMLTWAADEGELDSDLPRLKKAYNALEARLKKLSCVELDV